MEEKRKRHLLSISPPKKIQKEHFHDCGPLITRVRIRDMKYEQLMRRNMYEIRDNI